jgi:hypothetical protein
MILTAEIAQQFLNEPDYVDLDDYTSIQDDAAVILAKYKGKCLNLDGLTRLSDSAAESLRKHQGEGLSLEGLPELSDAAAESLGNHMGEWLYLGGLTELSDAATVSLGNYTGGWLSMTGLTHLPKAIAELYSSNSEHPPFDQDLCLDALTEISDAAATALSNFKGNLDLSGLSELSDAAAESLSKLTGQLDLSGLTELSDAAAESFAESLSKDDGWLAFNGLTKLSDAAAESLSKHQGRLYLSGLTKLSDAAAESLSKHQGDLYLWGLTELSDAAAESLSKHEALNAKLAALDINKNPPQVHINDYGLQCQIDDHRTVVLETEDPTREVLTLEILEGFLDDQGKVPPDDELECFTHIDDDAAERLSKHQGEAFDLEGLLLNGLSDAAAKSLTKYEGALTMSPDDSSLEKITNSIANLLKQKLLPGRGDWDPLEFDGLTELSDVAAEALASFPGQTISFESLTKITDSAAERLGRFEGTLSLHGLTELSDAATESLNKAGELYLCGLTEISDAAAESLGRHQGILSLRGLTQISEAAANSLKNHKGELMLDELINDKVGEGQPLENKLKTAATTGNPEDEIIVGQDFDYCDISYKGYQIIKRKDLSRLVQIVESGGEVFAMNAPGNWEEEFDLSLMADSFSIHSEDPADIESMRKLFGDGVGTDYISYLLEDYEEEQEDNY